jgi:lipopolysaccharide export system protein LptA
MSNTNSMLQIKTLVDKPVTFNPDAQNIKQTYSSFYLSAFLLVFFSLSSTSSAVNALNSVQTNSDKPSMRMVEWKISGDSSTIDLQNQQIIYRGNASFISHNISIKGDLIKANQDSQSKTIEVQGKPALLKQSQNNKSDDESNLQSFKLTALKVTYSLLNNQLAAEQQVELTLTEQQSLSNSTTESIQISAHKMFSQQKNKLILIFQGSPLTLTINQANQSAMTAQAEHLSFDQQNNQLELTGNVVVTTGSEIIKAEKLRYNSLTQLIEIPQGAKPVQMSQPKEANNE